MGRIVVGLDGSEHAERALRRAADEARARGHELHVVTVFPPPEVVGVPGARFPVERIEVAEERARSHQDTWLQALSDTDGVEITRDVRMGKPSEELLQASKGADLLVVGSRGRGGFAGLLLGSVSQQCVTHASCPVVVIH